MKKIILIMALSSAIGSLSACKGLSNANRGDSSQPSNGSGGSTTSDSLNNGNRPNGADTAGRGRDSSKTTNTSRRP